MYGFQITYNAEKGKWMATITSPNGRPTNTFCLCDTPREATEQALDLLKRLNAK